MIYCHGFRFENQSRDRSYRLVSVQGQGDNRVAASSLPRDNSPHSAVPVSRQTTWNDTGAASIQTRPFN